MDATAPTRLPGELAEFEARVGACIRPHAPLGIAFSGGVDSSVLLALATRTLGAEQVCAILGVSPSLPDSERRAAHAVAASIGVRIVEIATREGENPKYRANEADRCYHCKHELFERISTDLLAREGLVAVAYGENADDVRRVDRPGAQAANEYEVLRPLAYAEMDKAAVRRVAAALALPSADKPAAPCLASRIPHFSEVTPEKLAQVEHAEAALRDLGFADLRVRHHGDVARIELPTQDIVRAVTEPLRERIRTVVRAAGFRFVSVDLGGLQSGAFTLPLVTVS
ncbi:ATP-dependent sacrificial sulfur transferase LarE [Nocardia goodfellowii]